MNVIGPVKRPDNLHTPIADPSFKVKRFFKKTFPVEPFKRNCKQWDIAHRLSVISSHFSALSDHGGRWDRDHQSDKPAGSLR